MHFSILLICLHFLDQLQPEPLLAGPDRDLLKIDSNGDISCYNRSSGLLEGLTSNACIEKVPPTMQAAGLTVSDRPVVTAAGETRSIAAAVCNLWHLTQVNGSGTHSDAACQQGHSKHRSGKLSTQLASSICCTDTTITEMRAASIGLYVADQRATREWLKR